VNSPAAGSRTMAGVDPARDGSLAALALGRRLAASLEVICHGQHPNGEIVSYRRDAEGNYIYCRTPFTSALVHEALSCFDTTSPGWLEGALRQVPDQAADWFATTVQALRRRMRNFLIWQQEPSATWRFFGRGSGIDPDVNTTVCAAMALQESYGCRSVSRWEEQQKAVWSFQSREGPFYTFTKPAHGGYGWLDEGGLPVVGFDRVVNAAVLRYLCRLSLQATPRACAMVEWLMGGIESGDLSVGTPLYPNPLSFIYVLGRIHAESGLPMEARFIERLVSALLGLQRSTGDFGGPLSTAMGASALLDLGRRGAELERARLAVLRHLSPGRGWTYEDLVVHGFGSPASTTAVSLEFLGRYQCLGGDPR
jgi:hypothetical protein